MGYILLIDDNEQDLERIRFFLSVLDYKVKVSNSWEAAKTLFDEDIDCDLVIGKGEIMQVSGSDITQYIRNSLKPLTPILFIGNTNNIDRNLFSAVLKPSSFKWQILKDSVASLLPK